MPDTFHALIEQSIPSLRRYANALCRNPDAAEDLVQDTLVRTLSARGQFAEGTNFMGWVSTILHHRFIDLRRRTRESMEPIDKISNTYLVALPCQETVIEFDEFARAFWRLSPLHQEILMLVGANGLNYQEAGETLGLAIGTVRSRLSRARVELRFAMDHKPKSRRTRLPERRAKGAPEFLKNLSRVARRGAWQAAAPQGALAEMHER